MKDLSIRNKIAFAFLFVLLMLITIGVINYRQLNKVVENSNWVTHTERVLSKVNEVMGSLKDAETGQRGYLLTGDDLYMEAYHIGVDGLSIELDELKALISDNNAQLLRSEKLEKLIEEKLAEMQLTIELRNNKGFESALKVVKTDEGKLVMNQIRALVDEMVAEENSLLEKRNQINKSSITTTKNISVVILLISIVVVIILIVMLSRIIAYPLKEMTNIANELSKGNLLNEIKSYNKDEIGILARSFEQMQSNLIKQLKEIDQGINILASSSSEIMASSTQLASSSAETATSVGETTTTVEEVKQTANVSNEKAKEVSENAVTMAEISVEGRNAIADTIEGMNKIGEQMNSISSMVVTLSEQSQTIGEITATVNELAEQSNLLAVNASIEAAKAGEHGKGFTVVAQEIKLLANRSKEATSQVRTILRDVQKSISSAVMATEEGGKAVNEGLTLTKQSGDVIQTLSDSIEEASNAAIQIAASSQQQLEGMNQMVVAMESIREASMQAAASTKQSVDSVTDLQNVGQNLKEIMKQYILKV